MQKLSVQKLKNKVNDMSKEKNIPHEVLYQNFFFEHFLHRLATSKYKEKLILKGGFMLSSLLGIENRSTSDLDLTVSGIQMDEEKITSVISEICSVENNEVTLEVINIAEIRHDDKYDGLRVTINGEYNGLKFPFKLDLSTGDQITPHAMIKDITLNINEDTARISTYNFETVLVEKVETILSRGVANTRAKDFFDVYSLVNVYDQEIKLEVAKAALVNTMRYRESSQLVENIDKILSDIEESDELKNGWNNYSENYFFAEGISYKEVIASLRFIIEKII